MAHDSPRMFVPPISTKCPGTEGGSGGGLAPLGITSCLPPTPATAAAAAAAAASTNGSIVGAITSLSSSDTLASFVTSASPLMVHVDRAKVIGVGQYSTVCMGTLEPHSSLSLSDAGARGQLIPCAIKIPHANNLDAQELGLIEAAAFSQLGADTPATVECFGLADLQGVDLNGFCEVLQWPAAAPHAVSGKGEWALVLEYCEKGSCWTWMMENKLAMDAELFFHWARQLTLALIALHAAGMAHKDIKGHNMLGHSPTLCVGATLQLLPPN
ncbi:hypothetical protein GQ54DRAFT_305300 [Martensiomyces pterosporus]|nr:hypothetical protein GQ54DRAFT_305300 [Martensiomyces pterosporus]